MHAGIDEVFEAFIQKDIPQTEAFRPSNMVGSCSELRGQGLVPWVPRTPIIEDQIFTPIFRIGNGQQNDRILQRKDMNLRDKTALVTHNLSPVVWKEIENIVANAESVQDMYPRTIPAFTTEANTIQLRQLKLSHFLNNIYGPTLI